MSGVADPNLKISEKAKRQEEDFLRDLRQCLERPEFRRVMGRFLDESGIMANSADNSGSWTYFKEGKREMGIYMKESMERADPKSFVVIYLETIERKQKDV